MEKTLFLTVIFMAAGSPASATIYDLSVNGTTSGLDYYNTFGLGQELTNVAYTEVFRLNDSVPGADYSAGSASSFAKSLGTVDFTINNKTIQFGYTTTDESFIDKFFEDSRADYDVAITTSSSLVGFQGAQIALLSKDPSLTGSPDWRTPFSIVPSKNSSSSVAYGFLDDAPDSFGSTIRLNGNVSSATLSVAPAAVPEPATWAMMIGGVGLIGTALRLRRMTVAFA